MPTTFANNSKSSSTFANNSKSSSTFANNSKSLRVFGDITMEELADYTFQSVVLSNGTILDNVTFETLVDIIWTNQNKN